MLFFFFFRCAVLNDLVQTVSLSCGEMTGRYLNVIIPGSQKILSLAEVEVYKKKGNSCKTSF